MAGTYRPANIGGPEALHVVNQLLREMQDSIDRLRANIPQHKIQMKTGTLNFGAIPAGTAVERSAQVAGAAQKSTVKASPQLGLGNTHLTWSEFVPSSGVVTVRLFNPTGAPITPNIVTWNFSVIT